MLWLYAHSSFPTLYENEWMECIRVCVRVWMVLSGQCWWVVGVECWRGVDEDERRAKRVEWRGAEDGAKLS